MTGALDFLEKELGLLRASSPVVSTNTQTRLDGRPYANQRKADDPGASVYFTLRRRRVVLACDKWQRVEDNLQAIAKHIESMRGQDRWGVGNLEQAFAGYTALPEKREPDCWQYLGIEATTDETRVIEAYRRRALDAHPDRPGGNQEAFVALGQAKDIALATIRSNRRATT